MAFCRILVFYLMVAVLVPCKALGAEIVGLKASGKQEVVTVTLPKKGAYKIFTLGNPDRLVIDLPALQPPVKAGLPRNYKGKLIHTIRYGQFDPQTSRFVFELNGPAKILETLEKSDKNFQLNVTIAAVGDVTPRPRRAEPPEPEDDASGPGADEEQPVAVKTKHSKKGEGSPKTATLKPSAKPLIVIDAGHGGVDPGAIGVGGIYEKHITLDYARALQDALLRTGRYRVMMTREGDQFILLRKRVEMAREAMGNLFVSLHADSAPEVEAKGVSVYTLSENASDKEAEALAERENKADIIANLDLSKESEDVAGILISLAQRDTKNQSSMLADLLVLTLSKNVATLPNPHRFAGFAVLKAPDIPSVLVELGFLSNPAEAKRLTDNNYRDRVVRGLVKGVDAYFVKKREGF